MPVLLVEQGRGNEYFCDRGPEENLAGIGAFRYNFPCLQIIEGPLNIIGLF